MAVHVTRRVSLFIVTLKLLQFLIFFVVIFQNKISGENFWCVFVSADTVAQLGEPLPHLLQSPVFNPDLGC